MNEKGSGPNLGKTFATALFSILLVVSLIGGLTYYGTKAINNANSTVKYKNVDNINNKAKLEVRGYFMFKDACVRNEIFQQCIQNLPKGPEVTKYNDWDEVVGECSDSSYYISNEKKLGSHIPDGCIDLESVEISSKQYMDITGKPYTGN